jgi:uncharacterized membrane protein YbjE (DUF340 family)
MLSTKDYAKMTLEELVSEEKKMTSQKTTIAVIVGILVGAAVWSATHKGGFVTFILLLFSFWFGNKFSQDLKRLQAEISSRDTVG